MRTKITTLGEIFWLGKNEIPYNFAMLARVRGSISPEALRTALVCVCERHPLARMRVEIDAEGTGWLESEGVPEIPVRELEAPCAEDAWQPVVLDELGQTFDPVTGPLVRLVLLRRAGDAVDLIVVFNHYICDGMSGAFFTRDLLSLLGDPCTLLQPLHPPAGDLTHLLPPSARAARMTRMTLWGITRLTPLVRMFQNRFPGKPLPGGPLPPWKRFCMLTWSLDAAQTRALLARCRAEKTTVHTALCTAWLRADAEIETGPKRSLRRVNTPINLRQRLIIPVGETFGIFMSSLTTPIDCSDARGFWDVARELKQKMQYSSHDKHVFEWVLRTNAAIHGLSRPERRRIIDTLSNQPPDYDLAITNLGRLDFPNQYGDLHVEALYGPLVNGFALERTVSALTFDGVMYGAFLFRDFVLDPQVAQKIMTRALSLLEEAVG